MKTEIKPCPFCGGEKMLMAGTSDSRVLYCADCNAQGPWTGDFKTSDLIVAWNKRATPATLLQSAPTGNGSEITPMVIADLQARREMGLAKYGTPLRANNGRDALVDAYQESLDLCQYLRQAIEERGVK